MTERQELRQWIKNRYPIDSIIWDSVEGDHPYTVKKSSVFEIYESEYANTPADKDIYIDFFVKDAGKYSPLYRLVSYPKGWVLDKYNKKEYENKH